MVARDGNPPAEEPLGPLEIRHDLARGTDHPLNDLVAWSHRGMAPSGSVLRRDQVHPPSFSKRHDTMRNTGSSDLTFVPRQQGSFVARRSGPWLVALATLLLPVPVVGQGQTVSVSIPSAGARRSSGWARPSRQRE